MHATPSISTILCPGTGSLFRTWNSETFYTDKDQNVQYICKIDLLANDPSDLGDLPGKSHYIANHSYFLYR